MIKPVLADARKYMLTDEFRNADHASQDALVSAVQQMERALGGSGKVSFKNRVPRLLPTRKPFQT